MPTVCQTHLLWTPGGYRATCGCHWMQPAGFAPLPRSRPAAARGAR